MNALEGRRQLPTSNSLGKYRLLASLGHGGMADVFLAVAEGPAGVSKLQVVKLLRHALAEEPDFLNMFLDEARLGVRLNHPNVVQTNEVGQVGNDYFIAMEYLEGQPLNRILLATKQQPPPSGFSLQVVADALSGLQYAHELTDYDGTPLNIVHRDTSPHNIFVTYEGQTKLVDFGIAKAARRSAETNAGTIKGKFMYMSPEQARCIAVDRRADIFVMGIVLWEIIVGRRMWKGLSDIDLITRLIAGDIPRIKDASPGAPASLVSICDRALSLKPEDRYATAAEMRREILAYMKAEGLHATVEAMSSYLMSAYAERRAEMRKVIDAQLSRATTSADIATLSGSDSPHSTSLPELGSITVPSSITPPSMPSSYSRRQVSPSSILSDTLADATPRKSRAGLYLAGGLLAGAVLMGVATFGRRSAEPSAAASAAQAPTAARVELRLRAEPASAQMFLDDAPLPSNPFTGKFPADGLTHRLRIEASGHVTRTQLVSFDKDAAVDVALAPAPASSASAEPAHGARGRAAPRPPPPGPAARPEAHAPGPTPAPPISAPAPTATPVATATKTRRALGDPWGDETKPAEAPKRELDSMDP